MQVPESVKYSRGYRIILQCVAEENSEVLCEESETCRSLDEARRRFNYHATYVGISKAHKLAMGVPPETGVVYVKLWDNREGFELDERMVTLKRAS